MTVDEFFYVCVSKTWIGLRIGRRYFKFRDTREHPLRFSEREGIRYRRIARRGAWELGVTTS